MKDIMDGPGEHYAKWNMPVGERQVPCDFTHVDRDNSVMAVGGGGISGIYGNGNKFQ